jgi:hypothetical protein
MIEMMTRTEMTIPRSLYENIFLRAIYFIVMLASIMAMLNLITGTAVIVSGIWLIFISIMIWKACKNAGGLHKYLVNRLGEIAGRKFVESTSYKKAPTEIRFGYELFGHRFIQLVVKTDTIESVEWDKGQASGMTGRDMNDWSVYLWFDHNDPAKRKSWSRKQDQEIYVVGPSRRWEDTDAFGRSFVDFLRAAGAILVKSDNVFCFERRKP